MKRLFLLLCLFGSAICTYAELSITLNVETAGSLSTMIASSKQFEVTSLTLTGKLNGSDISFIRYMAGGGYKGSSTEGQLNYLDISGADIVKGGGSYAYEHTLAAIGYTDKEYYTSDNTITPFMFDDCWRLKTLILPNSVNTIEKDAFWNSDLVSITLPKNLKSFQCIIPSFYLSEIKISSDNNYFKVVDGVLYSHDMKTLYRCPTDYAGETFVIKESVEKVYTSAFFYCKNIKRINYSPSLKTFGYQALAHMSLSNFVVYPNVAYSTLGSFTKIEEVEIKDGFTTFDNMFGSGSDRYGTDIKRIKIHCSTPPTIRGIFNSETRKGTLFVPVGTYSSYYIVPGWGDFRTIVEDSSLGGGVIKYQCETPQINYTNGKICFSCATPNAEYQYTISTPDTKIGKTNDCIEFVAYYDISVFASADGYTDSEIATAKLYWVNGTLYPTGINSVQANARGVLVQSNNGVLTISGLEDNEQVSLYDLSGKMLDNARAFAGEANFIVNNSDKIIIIKVDNESIKVKM